MVSRESVIFIYLFNGEFRILSVMVFCSTIWWLDFMILEVFSKLYNSMIL